MTNLEKEFIYLSQLVFDFTEEETLEDIKEAGGLVRVNLEGGDYIYYGADGTPFALNSVHFFDALVSKKILEPVKFPTDADINKPTFQKDFDKAFSISRERLTKYLENLRSDIASGKIAI